MLKSGNQVDGKDLRMVDMRQSNRINVARSDDDLMQAIAHRRDKDAFKEIYHRYKNQAYNVAYHVTRQAHFAEEGIQQGMMRVWISAKSYKPSGNAKAWILSIITNECIQIIRKNRNTARKENTVRKNSTDISFSSDSPNNKSERKELLRFLNQCLEEMPESQRQIVALYFGCNMSQQEISETLAMSQTNVSKKLKEILGDLRNRLKKSGVIAGVSFEALCKDFFTQQVAPTQLEPTLLNSLDQQIIAVEATSGSFIAPTFIAVGIIAAAVYLSGELTPDTTETASPKPPTAFPKIPNEKPSLVQNFVFADKMPEGMDIISGTFDFWPNDWGNLKFMAASPYYGGYLITKDPLPEFPVLITTKVYDRLRNDKKSGLVFLLEKNGELLSNTSSELKSYSNLFKTYKTYIFNNRVITFQEDKIARILDYPKDLDSKGCRLGIYLQNIVLHQISIKKLTPEEIPSNLLLPTKELFKGQEILVRAGKQISKSYLKNRPRPRKLNNKIYYRFAGGIPNDFKLGGKIKYRVADKDSPAAIFSNELAQLVLDKKIKNINPFKIRLKYRKTALVSYFGAGWKLEKNSGRVKVRNPIIKPMPEEGDITVYFDRNVSLTFVNEEPYGLYFHSRPFPSDTILISFKCLAIEEIDYVEIPREKFPPLFGKVPELMKTWERDKPVLRN